MISLKRIQQIPKIRKYLPWVTVALVFAVSYPAFIRPLRQTLQAHAVSGHIETLYQEHLDRLHRITTKQKEQRQALMELKRQQDPLLFESTEADAFFSKLDQTAVSFGCRVVSAEYEILEMPDTDSKEGQVPVCLHGAKIQLTGRYDRWIQFLGWIESLPQNVLMYSLRLESQKDRSGILSGRIDLAIPVYMKGLPSEPADSPHPKEN